MTRAHGFNGKLILANWKANKNERDSKFWFAAFNRDLDGTDLKSAESFITLAIAPSFPLLAGAREAIFEEKLPLTLAVQDISPFAAGSYTGAVSNLSLEGLEIKFAIIGHSERRRYFGETAQDIARKVDQALLANIMPVVCVDKDNFADTANALTPAERQQIIVAYEPTGAIGSGHNEDVGIVKNMMAQIRDAFGVPTLPVLYGGSVDENNVREYLLVCDGVLVGTASLDPNSFASLVKSCLVI